MKRIIVIISLLCMFSMQLSAQYGAWSEPIIVRNIDTYCEDPDICSDTEGVLHAVWTEYLTTTPPKKSNILYSKSLDNGYSWSTPQNISKNNNTWVSNAKIIADEYDNLYVTYDDNVNIPTKLHVCFTELENGTNNWSYPIILSKPHSYSYYSKLAIFDGVLYSFWFRDYYIIRTMEYRMLTSSGWSDIKYITPPDGNTRYVFKIFEANHILHALGCHLTNNAYDIEYCNSLNGTSWSNYEIINDNSTNKFLGLADVMTQKNKLNVVWKEESSDSDFDIDIITAEKENNSWSESQQLIESLYTGDVQSLAFATDKNNVKHITFERMKNGRCYLMDYIYYQNNWIGKIVNDYIYSRFCNVQLQILHGDLYLMYTKYINNKPSVKSTICLRKYDELDILSEQITALSTFKLSPNPVASTCQFSYHLAAASTVNIQLYNSQGQAVCTIYNGQQPAGQQQIEWDAQGLSAGIYFVRLQVGKYVINAKLVKA